MKTTKATIEDILISSHSGFACSKRYETTEKEGVFHMRPNNIGYWGKINLSKKVFIQKSKIEASKVGIKKGQILFNNTNSKELVGRAVFVSEDIDAGFSNHLTRLVVDETEIDPRWLTYQINKLWSEGYFLRICRKWIGQAGVDMKMLKSIEIEYPELTEQKNIADKLDKVFEMIEQEISKTKAHKERAISIISSHLNEVFGEDYMKTYSLDEVCDTTSGGTPSRSRKDFYDGEIAWLKSGELNDNRAIASSEEHISELALEKSNAKIFPSGTVLMAMYGATVGKLGILKVDASTNQAVCAITPHKGVLNEYVFWYLFFYRSELVKKAFGGAQPNISQTLIRKVPVKVPVIDGKVDPRKQDVIVEKIKAINTQSEKLVELLSAQEKYFTSLRASVLRQSFQMQT